MAALKWGRNDFHSFGDFLAGFLFSHPFWLLGVAIFLVAIGGRWIPQMLRSARDWVGKDWIPLGALALLIFLAFVFDRNKFPAPFYLVCWAIIWFLLVYLLKWESPTDSIRPPVDSLNRSYFAEGIAELFRNGRAAPHRIAILGPWGSGKSVLLNLLRHRLANEGGFRIVMVNPWKPKTPDEAWGILAGRATRPWDCPPLCPLPGRDIHNVPFWHRFCPAWDRKSSNCSPANLLDRRIVFSKRSTTRSAVRTPSCLS